MDFCLSGEHKLLQDTVRRFSDQYIGPWIKKQDEEEQFNREILEKMAGNGLLGLCVPEQYGGSGMDFLALALACEELARVDVSGQAILAAHLAIGTLPILQWGSEEQIERFVKPQAAGTRIAAGAITEPDAGSDIAGIKTVARREGDYYLLSGEKTWITLANSADNFLVLAYTEPSLRHRGMSCFLVDRESEGLQTQPLKGKLGTRAADTGSIFMDQVRVHRSNMLGEEGEGFKIALSSVSHGWLCVAGGALGIADACLEASVRYALERETFGKPLGRHQLIQRRIAHMVSGIEASRLLIHRAAWLKDQGETAIRETGLAKWNAAEVAFEAANSAIEIHGAYGYSNEFSVERHLRNAQGSVIYGGTREMHEIMQAGYALGFREDKPFRRQFPR